MRLPAPVGTVDVRALVDGIASRRRAADDPNLERMPEADDPMGVVSYVLANLGRMPKSVCTADIGAALVLIRAARLRLDRLELALLRQGRAHGASWQWLGGFIGITSRQGAQKRAKQLQDVADAANLNMRVDVLRRLRRDQPVAEAAGARPAAQALVLHRKELLTDEGVDEWLAGLAFLLEHGRTETDERSLAVQVALVVDDIRELAAECGRPVAATPAALAAFQAAAQVAARQ